MLERKAHWNGYHWITWDGLTQIKTNEIRMNEQCLKNLILHVLSETVEPLVTRANCLLVFGVCLVVS